MLLCCRHQISWPCALRGDDRHQARRQELETQHSELLKISGNGNGSHRGHPKTRIVAVRYRNPKNADEVWSDRGRMPLRLGAQIKAGKIFAKIS